MGNIFRDILLVSDLDGTLIGDAFQVPERNQIALRRFQQEGGRFAIATGRALDSAARYAHLTSPNAPCIVLNGTMIYDFDHSKILWEHPLPPNAKEYVQKNSAQVSRNWDRGLYGTSDSCGSGKSVYLAPSFP